MAIPRHVMATPTAPQRRRHLSYGWGEGLMVCRGGPWKVQWYAVEDAVEDFSRRWSHGMPRHVCMSRKKNNNNVHIVSRHVMLRSFLAKVS